jgi:hypothetical protein
MHDAIEFQAEPHDYMQALNKLYLRVLLSPLIDTQTEAIVSVAGCVISTDYAL